MASRLVFIRRKSLLDHINAQTRPIHSFSIFGLGRQYNDPDAPVSTKVADSPSANADNAKEKTASVASKTQLLGFSKLEYVRYNSWPISIVGQRYGRPNIVFPIGSRWISGSQVIHAASTATAGQPQMRNEDESKEERNAKQIKEASPEECDQAVEGLSTVKAQAKAKQFQDSKKDAMSIVKKFWAMLLGIGPALRVVASMSREDWAKKLHHWKDEFVSTLQHYWLGIKLLWADVRISSRLLLKLAGGKSLSRRERQQLTRTTADIFRLVHVAVFIIVPFMEFLLPVFLKLFPNMLPSTFQDKMKELEALKRRLNARIEYAKFLQETAKEMAKEVQVSRSGEIKKTAEDLDDFLNKVRTGASVSNEEILGFAKLFNDELTLDNISRPRIVNMCKYMGISPYGTDAYLRYMLRKKLGWLFALKLVKSTY